MPASAVPLPGAAGPAGTRSAPGELVLLNARVPAELARRWASWLAPERQPFFLTGLQAARLGLTAGERVTDPQLRDTYAVWDDRDLVVAWLDEAEFLRLPRTRRAALLRAQLAHGRAGVPAVRRWSGVVGPAAAAQGDGHRFVWWPSLLAGRAETVLADLVTDGMVPGRLGEVPDRIWHAACSLLPGARGLADTFAPGSGPNCFGTVMAAAGVPAAASVWMLREPFEDWLAAATVRGGRDDAPGTVLVWRSARDGLVQHAAVTLGGGWALNKYSQCWYSPRQVLTVAEVKAGAREVGWRLSRYAMA
jgi:hypothetical protein